MKSSEFSYDSQKSELKMETGSLLIVDIHNIPIIHVSKINLCSGIWQSFHGYNACRFNSCRKCSLLYTQQCICVIY